jgi:hypothetical protein
VYPAHIFGREVRAFASAVVAGRAYGEIEHPPPTSPHFRDINLRNVSHRVLDLWWEKGTELHGVVEVLPSAAGKVVWRLYACGEAASFASRGWATLVPDPHGTGVTTVGPDMQLITFDAVRVGSLSSPFRPIVGVWDNLKAAQVLQARAAYWKAQGEVAPEWPYGNGCPLQQQVAATDGSSQAAVRRGWAVTCPALELMSHQAEFRQRARALFQMAAGHRPVLGDAGAIQFIISKAAAVDAEQLLVGHLADFRSGSESGTQEEPPRDEARHVLVLVKYAAQPPGLAWQPQRSPGAAPPVLWVAMHTLLRVAAACCETPTEDPDPADSDSIAHDYSDASSDDDTVMGDADGDANDFYELEEE